MQDGRLRARSGHTYDPRMRRDLMDILACPVCKGPLVLTVTRDDGEEIVEGSLRCEACRETYPIADGIPNLLPPQLRDAAPTAQPGAAH